MWVLSFLLIMLVLWPFPQSTVGLADCLGQSPVDSWCSLSACSCWKTATDGRQKSQPTSRTSHYTDEQAYGLPTACCCVSDCQIILWSLVVPDVMWVGALAPCQACFSGLLTQEL